jgi:hypothetical protein
MSTTQTSHEPGPDELAAEADPHADRAVDTHADGHGDGHGGDALGPVDVRAWGALAIGVAAGLVVAACLVISSMLSVTTA